VTPHLETGRVSLYNYKASGPFHMTHAKNMAHRLGMLEGADVLVNLDADNYLGDGFEDFVSGVFKCDSNAFLWSGIVKGKGKKLRGVSGRLAVTPAAFLKAGGYDERFLTWARDDKDFNERLCYLGYRPIQTDNCYLEAIPHSDGIRFREWPEVREKVSDEDDAGGALQSSVVNSGNIGCGEVSCGNGHHHPRAHPDAHLRYRNAQDRDNLASRRPANLGYEKRPLESRADGRATCGMRCGPPEYHRHLRSSTRSRTCRSPCCTKNWTAPILARSSS